MSSSVERNVGMDRRFTRASIGGLALAALLALIVGPAPAEAYGGWCGIRPYWGGGWGYGAWGWSGAWGGPGGGWGGYTVVYPMADRTHGALDLDVSPERAQIYIDGKVVGEADDFDGFPDFLWLERGTYDVAIFHPGYQTLARQITIYAGQVIDVEDRLVPGQETRPEDLVSKSTERRDERLRRDRELEAEARQYEANESPEGESRRRNDPLDALDARGEPGRAVVRIRPDDASVYLDGRFLGTGRELSRLRSGLILDAGEHEMEVVRPGYEAETRAFAVESGQEVEIALELEAED